ncbi:MAG: NAD(P)H-hydrate dehydratase [Caldimonas sp.]
MSSLLRIDAAAARQALYGVAATRRIEARALAGMAPFTLMARAAASVARLALALAPHAQRVLVFAGPGNNGGDGIEAATCLRRFGKDASVLLVGGAARLPADAARALANAQQAGVVIGPASAHGGPGTDTDTDCPALVIDALLGIGASRPPAGEIAAAIERIATLAGRGAIVLAVDLPSGFDADHGQPFGAACVSAQHTLSLLTVKPGLFTGSGRDRAGTVWLDDLGVDSRAEPAEAWLVGRGELGRGAVARLHGQHKGSFGDVAVVGGSPGMAGAAWLAARAAHAAGAGRVFVDLLEADPASAVFDPERPELMLRPGWWQGPASAVEQSTVVCGCGGGDAVRATLPRLIALAPRLVLDADALNAIGADTALQATLAARARRERATLLTPHPLEAARLLGTSTQQVQADRLGAAGELAGRYRAVVVLKGSGSVIAAPGEPPRINATGNASLATAGTGDVLAGWIGGRWRPGESALEVATLAVAEHGAAAEPERHGALRAADLVERLYLQSRRA